MVDHVNINKNSFVNISRLQAISFMLCTSIRGVVKTGFEQDELVVVVELNHLIDLLILLKTHPLCRYEQLMDMCGVDYPQRADRFDIVYNLLSVSLNQRIRVLTYTDEQTPVPSVRELWKCVDWWERECYDMFGILFSGQPDLRRILTDYGFDGHPLRKDFPLTGYVEVRYDADQNKIVYEPVTLTQDMRNFDFDSPWEGLVTLPGDEKIHEKRKNVKPYSL